jgi:plasmid stabilization system protein ParE
MDLEIVWLEAAEYNLEDIFNYYKLNATLKTARKIVVLLVESVDVLLRNPFIGQREDLLKTRKTEYRYLVVENYKLIYSFDKKHVYIHLVFDARQNPVKIKRVK